MNDSAKSSRVSCVRGANVRQENIFVPEECPSKVGNKLKRSRSSAVPPKNCLAWYVKLNAKPSQEKLSHIPQIKWKCPPKFTLNVNWRVAAGEGSVEAEVQKQRETAVREAIYPHLSVIPPSPFVSLDLGAEDNDDRLTPIIPIEEEEEEASAATEIPSDSQLPDPSKGPLISGNLTLPSCNSAPASQNPPVNDNSLPSILHRLGSGDLAVAAAAAATAAAVMENKERIDTELLIKVLTDPEMIKKLIDQSGVGARPEPVTLSAPVPSAPQVRSAPLCTSRPVEQPSPFLISKSNEHLIRNLTDRPERPMQSHFHQIAGTNQVQPRTPYATTSNEISFQRTINSRGNPCVAGIKPLSPLSSPSIEVIKKMINEYGSPDATAIKSVAPPIPSTSKRPNMEEMKKMINQYGAPYNALPPKLLIGSNPLKSGVAVAFPPNSSSTGMFHYPPFQAVTIPAPPVKDLNYCKSLIKQHGENHENEQRPPILGRRNSYLQRLELGQNTIPIELNPQFQNPCMYSNSPRGWPHGPYQHTMSGQWRPPPGGVAEVPHAKRMKFHDKSGRF